MTEPEKRDVAWSCSKCDQPVLHHNCSLCGKVQGIELRSQSINLLFSSTVEPAQDSEKPTLQIRRKEGKYVIYAMKNIVPKVSRWK